MVPDSAAEGSYSAAVIASYPVLTTTQPPDGVEANRRSPESDTIVVRYLEVVDPSAGRDSNLPD